MDGKEKEGKEREMVEQWEVDRWGCMKGEQHRQSGRRERESVRLCGNKIKLG